MDLGIGGRVAVVTGASRGIGEATAALLEAEGARVVRVSRTDGIDVKAPDAAERIAALAPGPVDILVNNAGTSVVRRLDDVPDEEWLEQFEMHVMASMRLMRAFAPGMAERGWGRIVNVSSSSGKRPSSNLSAAYSVAKAGQLSLSRLYADAYAARGVLVNAVAPGPTATPQWLAEGGLGDQTAAAKGLASREEAIEAQGGRAPLGRFAEPDEIAAVIAFLCSERASFVSGAAWSVDGGVVATIV
jgi:NAD(P)-dependent dehydrogenase (short-subunit alcohol dehydrogenase family)